MAEMSRASINVRVTADTSQIKTSIAEAEKAIKRFAKEHGITRKKAMKVILARIEDVTTWRERP